MATLLARRFGSQGAVWLLLGLLTLLGLGLRLLAWRWHELYPLGGDEREYLDLALSLARRQGYYDLQLMRPPLYPALLAVGVWLVDGSTQGLRLIQALVSTATIPLTYLWSQSLFAGHAAAQQPRSARRAALLAAALAAFSYTLALNATELLTETLFLAGLTLLLWLLLLARRRGSSRLALLAGVALGLLALLRSVALPLLLLGAVSLWWRGQRRRLALLFVAGALLVILPWTVRNALTYEALIIIDTTGQENLWLDNDPAGREAVKRQLYALGAARGERARLATSMGLRAIVDNPGHVAGKAWEQLQLFFALEHADDLRARPGIWVRPVEVWLRLLLGDGLWLILLLCGLAGLILGPGGPLRGLLMLWVAYTLLTGMLFHVELRYRLPLYPALLPYAGWALARRPRLVALKGRRGHAAAAGLLLAAVLALLLLHAPYPAIAWQLGRKHLHLTRADAALATGDWATGQMQAQAALQLDARSALARVALARAALQAGDEAAAERWLRQAVDAIPSHPYAHLLLGDLLRQRGDAAGARRELAYETSSLEDLQRWAWNRFSSPLSAQLDVGGGLDLGWLLGFYAAEDGTRWTRERASLRLARPAHARQLRLRLRSPRPAGAPPAGLVLLVDGQQQLHTVIGQDWQELLVPLPPGAATTLLVELQAPTFRPHDYERASPDGRQLGVELDALEVLP